MKSGHASSRRRQTLPGIPGVYVLLFCDLVRQLGYDEQWLLEGLEPSRADLLAPDSRVSVADAAQVLHRGLAVAGRANRLQSRATTWGPQAWWVVARRTTSSRPS